jgi:NAD(P)-dependent dehydrogenase (short-subunit alcohol dehydrogenase family)
MSASGGMNMAGGLFGQVVLVTGGGGGLGQAACELLASEGATIVIFDLDAVSAEASAKRISSTGAVAGWVTGDTTNYANCQSAVEAAIAHGRLDVLVNCAGISAKRSLLDMEPDLFRKVIDVNLVGYWNMIRAAAGVMKPGARIVQIASVAGHIGYSDTAYAASKAAVLGMTRQLARELGALGIRINSVSPGVVDSTALNVDALAIPEIRADAISHTTLGRLASRRDIAEAILFLASDRSSYITGTDLLVDGGMSSYVARLDPKTLKVADMPPSSGS